MTEMGIFTGMVRHQEKLLMELIGILILDMCQRTLLISRCNMKLGNNNFLFEISENNLRFNFASLRIWFGDIYRHFGFRDLLT